VPRPLSPIDQIALIAIFGGAFLYFLYGALVGDLFIPYKYGDDGLHLKGLPAWMLVVSQPLFYASILVRYDFLQLPERRLTQCLEVFLLLAGLSAFAGGMWIGMQQACCA
jgi:hypothetical protein